MAERVSLTLLTKRKITFQLTYHAQIGEDGEDGAPPKSGEVCESLVHLPRRRIQELPQKPVENQTGDL